MCVLTCVRVRVHVVCGVQGMLADQWFTGALAAVAYRQELLLDLIVSDDNADMGLYTFQFYKHGTWHQVTVDNYLPVRVGDSDQWAFAASAVEDVLWPSLMEKAYAKLHGSFYSLETGSVCEALEVRCITFLVPDLHVHDAHWHARMVHS